MLYHLVLGKKQAAVTANDDIVRATSSSKYSPPVHLPAEEPVAAAEMIVETGFQADNVFLKTAREGFEMRELRWHPLFVDDWRVVYMEKRVERRQPKQHAEHRNQGD